MKTIQFDHLLGKQFVHGTQDCFTLVRNFYQDNWGIELTNYARPDGWWDKGMNLYMDALQTEGFEVLTPFHPRDLRIGDGFLIGLASPVANHAAIYVGRGDIIHHVVGRLSNRELYRGPWKNHTLAVVRHKLVTDVAPDYAPFNLLDDPRIARRIRDGKID
jgi:cell wall-associated NlpC family hydrolase